jgi:endonuclease-8
MTGSWRVQDRGRPRTRAAWLVLRRGGTEVLQLHGPVLELMTDSRTRLDQRIAGLGPDILAPEFDEKRFLRRLRDDDPTRPIGDALLDQSTVAGIGNLWKVEGCFEARIDPWRPTGRVSDEEALAVVRAIRPKMQASALDGRQARFRTIHGSAGAPCPRCGESSRIRSRGQGDGNRTTYWCPACQL